MFEVLCAAPSRRGMNCRWEPSKQRQVIHRLVWAAALSCQNLTRPACIKRPQAKAGGLRLSAQGTSKAQ